MMYASLAAFAAAAIAGIFLATRHFLRKRLPVWVALLHGLGGATGFTVLLLIVVRDPTFELARRALYLFIATIALGSVNLLFHIRGVRHRTSLIAMHALAAVSGVGTLLYSLFVPSAPPPVPAPSAPASASAPPSVTAPAVAAATASAAPPLELSSTAPVAQAQPFIDPELGRELGHEILFASGSATLAANAGEALGRVASALLAHPEVALVEVQGHADRRGDDTRNLELTRTRARAIVELLVAKGIARARLHSAGYGARCAGDADLERDRRVVFVPLRVGARAFSGELVCAAGASLIPREDQPYHKH